MRCCCGLVLVALGGCGRLAFDAVVASDATDGSDATEGSDGSPMSCAQFGPWTAPSVVPGVNTTASDADPFLTVDGLTLYFTTERTGVREIWKATRASPTAAWDPPAVVPELSASLGNDGNPALTSDELQVYWGLGVFHKATRTSKTQPFSNDEIIPEGSAYTDALAAAISSDDLEMYIPASPVGGGVRRIVRVTRPDTSASFDLNTAVELPHSAEQQFPAISPNNRELIYETDLGSGYDMYRMTRPSTAVEFDLATEEPIDELNVLGMDDADPTFSADGKTLIFDSTRIGGAGDFDLWTTSRSCL